MSTFHGLEMAKQALFAQQSAIYTTGHNIANANTKGYSRQRVNFETLPAYPMGSRNRPEIPGQLGTGVQIGSVQRIRDLFLDAQYRAENSRFGFWETKANTYHRIEELLNEPSDRGLSNVLDEFWQSLQDLATNPENIGARSVVVNRAQAVTETFNYFSETLKSIKNDLKHQIDTTVDQVNSLVRQIHQINDQIRKVEPHGLIPNDLYDDRDRLIDELSKIVSIKVEYEKSSESSLEHAQGIAKIELVDDQGRSINSPKLYLLENSPDGVNHLSVEYNEDGEVSHLTLESFGTIDYEVFEQTMGSLKAMIEAYGYEENGEVKGDLPLILNQLDQMASEFAKAFNEIHEQGYDLLGDEGIAFFEHFDSAETISVREELIKNPELVAASLDGTYGDGRNATELANLFHESLDSLNHSSVNTFYESLIGKLGVQAREANRMQENASILHLQVDEQRQTVSSVSLDEEMVNLLQFQHAYHAAARSMTAVDELLDKIINGMGLVGR